MGVQRVIRGRQRAEACCRSHHAAISVVEGRRRKRARVACAVVALAASTSSCGDVFNPNRQHTCYEPGWGSDRLTGTLSAVDSSGSQASGTFVRDLVTGEDTGPTRVSFQAAPGVPGKFMMLIGRGVWLAVQPLQRPGTYAVSAPQLCIRTCPSANPSYIAGWCQSDAGMVAPSDCLAAQATLVIGANSPSAGSPGVYAASSPEPVFDSSLKLDLTISPQPTVPLSGQFSLDYQVVSVAQVTTSIGCN
jgi:hypothetical protein